MKKTYLLIFVFLIPLASFAQERKTEKMKAPQKISFSANVGASSAGALIRLGTSQLASKMADLGVASSSATPALQASAEFKAFPHVSFGFAYSYQMFKAEYTAWIYSPELVFDMGAKLTRANYSGRILYHYGNFKNVDIYSGVRIGYTMWSLEASIHTPDIDPTVVIPGVAEYLDWLNVKIPGMDLDAPKLSMGFIAPQVVLFGCRYYFNDYIGINTELTVGSPHYISGGLSLRF